MQLKQKNTGKNLGKKINLNNNYMNEEMYARFLKGFFRDAFAIANTDECIVKFDSKGDVISIIPYDKNKTH